MFYIYPILSPIILISKYLLSFKENLYFFKLYQALPLIVLEYLFIH